MSHVYPEHSQTLMAFAAAIIENECDTGTQHSSSTLRIQTREDSADIPTGPWVCGHSKVKDREQKIVNNDTTWHVV